MQATGFHRLEKLLEGDFFVKKKLSSGWSRPISCTLPHSKPLAHWRQVRRNYLFQGGYPRYHLICTPLLVPSVSRDCGIWASPLEAGLELLFQGGYPRYYLICTPPRRAPFLGPYSLSSFPATQILPTASV